MKFGATLSRRSVPQWRTHDLDYDEIKILIKRQTSSPEGCSRDFEKQLLAVLDSELTRIDDFVRCKAGEIERRLVACQRSVKNLAQEQAEDKSNGKQQQSTLKRFFKMEAEIDRVSQDTQSLARFIGAQYTGFRKLLKKHAKWCHLSPTTPHSLTSQFLPRLETKRPFHRRVNFQDILRQLSALYNAKSDPESLSSTDTSVTAFVESDFSSMDSVTYWVHVDNQVETELFLLKHLTLQIPCCSPSIQRTSRIVYLDNDKKDVYNSIVPQNANQPVNGTVPHLIWEDRTRSKEVGIIMPSDDGEIKSLQLKKSTVNGFLSSDEEDWSISKDEDWLLKAKSIQRQIHSSGYRPVIQTTSQRTGFIKLPRTRQSNPSRIYATMDTNIISSRLPNGPITFDNEDDPDLIDLPGHQFVFPHAVLQIRWEGDSPRWLEELNGSHLIERVNGFDMYTHSIAILAANEVNDLPYWLPLLKKDIQKLQPVRMPSSRRRGSTSPYLTADSKTNSSVEVRPDTAPTSVGSPRRQKRYGAVDSPVVYWSEFDTQEEEPFLVPADESTFLLPWQQKRNHEEEREQNESVFIAILQKMLGAVEAEMKTSSNGLTTLFYEKNHPVILDEEQQPITSDEDSSAIEDHRPLPLYDHLTRQSLLNRGYTLCVIGCVLLLSLTGIFGILNGEVIGITFVLCGFLIAMTLEIVCLVRFMMQGGYAGVGWLGFVVVALAGCAFIPLVAMAEG